MYSATFTLTSHTDQVKNSIQYLHIYLQVDVICQHNANQRMTRARRSKKA